MKRLMLALSVVWALTASVAWAVLYEGREFRDPFFEGPEMPEKQEAAPAFVAPVDTWSLGGIMWSPSKRLAVINGQKTSEGQMIGQAEVLKIERSSVRLKRGGREGILTKTGIQWL